MKTTTRLFSVSLVIALLSLNSLHASAQSTYDAVYSLLQTNCATASCHSGATPTGNLDLSGSKTDVYNALIHAVPSNAAAAAKGYALVTPGYPRKSFLMKKINNGLDVHNDIAVDEGDAMPNGLNPLTDADIELIRQWILFAAPDTGTVVDAQLLQDFYNGGGKTKLPPLALPSASNGFQVLVGPFFMAPHTEVEYSIKQQLFNATPLKVVSMDAFMNEESHHLATFKYLPNKDTLMPVGLRKISGIADAAGVFYNSTIIAEWANSLELTLPQGTAFFWEDSAVIDFNYHIINYTDSILAAEVYVNIGTTNTTAPLVEMKAAPIYYGGQNVAALVIPPGDTTFTMLQFDPDSSYDWNLFMIVAHTHQYGKDFDVWKRNADGSKGDHIYNGHYNESYVFDQGFFDWEHPPVRLMDPMLTVDMAKGMIHEARYVNNTPDTIYFGLTTLDEMFVTYLLYTEELPTVGINDFDQTNNAISVYPNPNTGTLTIKFAEPQPDAQIEFYNLLGEMVQQELLLNPSNSIALDLPNGVYLYKVYANGALQASSRVVVVK